jgi:hypothetical protein
LVYGARTFSERIKYFFEVILNKTNKNTTTGIVHIKLVGDTYASKDLHFIFNIFFND